MLKEIGISVVADEEAVGMVEGLIRERDDLAMRLGQEMDEPLPCLVGKD
jgi:hypothetical protein